MKHLFHVSCHCRKKPCLAFHNFPKQHQQGQGARPPPLWPPAGVFLPTGNLPSHLPFKDDCLVSQALDHMSDVVAMLLLFATTVHCFPALIACRFGRVLLLAQRFGFVVFQGPASSFVHTRLRLQLFDWRILCRGTSGQHR